MKETATMPDDVKDPKRVLEDLDSIMDDLIRKMDIWEGKLRRMMEAGDDDALLEEAGKGGYFGRRVTQVRNKLIESRPIRTEDSPGSFEGQPSQEELDELELKIEDKCEKVSTKVDALLDEVTEIKSELSDKIKRSMDDLTDEMDILFDTED
jgi:hypothetical protein